MRALILMLLLISYKWLAHSVGIKRGFLSRYMTFEDWLKVNKDKILKEFYSS